MVKTLKTAIILILRIRGTQNEKNDHLDVFECNKAMGKLIKLKGATGLTNPIHVVHTNASIFKNIHG